MQLIEKNSKVGLVIDDSVMLVMATTPLSPKGLPKNRKRLARIKVNLIRELRAFNKEIRRHRGIY